MKITCPNCNANDTIPSHLIPDEGRFLTCPRCKHGFTVRNPRGELNEFLVDICPACNFNSFGEERFEICPKCGVVVKAFLERQREEQRIKKEQELLDKNYSKKPEPQLPEESVLSENGFVGNLMNPLNLVGWGCAMAAAAVLFIGLMEVLDYDTAALKAQISAQLDKQVSTWYVFFHFGLMSWIKVLYGATVMITAYFFLQERPKAHKTLSILLRIMIVFVPTNMLISFVRWVLQPIPHSVSGYFIELFNLIVMTFLFGVPLALLDRFINGKKISAYNNSCH